MKFKKVSQSDCACQYALVEEIERQERMLLIDWLETHCPDCYSLGDHHLFLTRENELFFELTFPTI